MINEKFNIENKNIVLTGSSGRLGKQYAHFLSSGGANMILLDINSDTNQQLAEDIRSKYNTNCTSYKCNISNKKSVIRTSNSIIKKYSKIDGLINNAGFTTSFAKKQKTKSYSSSFEDLPIELWNQTLDVNLTGTFLCCQEFGKQMVKQKNGSIINIASHYGLIAPDQRIYGKSKYNSTVVYGLTKGAVLNFTRYLASYWNDTGIRVNTLSLGGVENNHDSNFIKNYSYRNMMGRMAQKDEYIGAMIFLLSDASSYMTGSNLVVDGGWSTW